MSQPSLIFLKLGGSLITEKTKPRTPRLEIIQRIAIEITSAVRENPDLQLVLGHGSGSFGHVAANQHHTRQGVHSSADWQGFVHVWQEARTLNQIVIEALATAGCPAIAFPPSVSLLCRDGVIHQWDLAPIQAALEHHLIPVVQGDVAFDAIRGGTIVSTEEVFAFLAEQLQPQRILLTGIEQGVWADFPACTRLVPRITSSTFASDSASLQGSNAVDVTGGMQEKVLSMLRLCQRVPGLEVAIFSGEPEGSIAKAIHDPAIGTLITG